MAGKKSIFTVAGVAALVFGFAVAGLQKSPDRYSDQERRALAQPPEFTVDRLLSGKFMKEFEDYAMDQFPLRERLRSLKAVTVRYVLGQRDDHGIYLAQGHTSSLEYPADEAARERNTAKLREIYQNDLADTDCKLYLSVIPDKNYFLASKNGYPSMDYEAFVREVREDLDFAEYIDIFPLLSLESYYRTDQHWRQERILPVAERLAEGMGAFLSDAYVTQELETPFYGAYAGQSALDPEPDTICYLTSDLLGDCIVTSYDTGEAAVGAVYDMEKAAGRDPYELFLSGSDALLTIENPDADTEKELVIFRDSFGSSLAPLLVSGYARITLADLRYIPSGMVRDFVDFEDQDVLFLYSTLVLNN